MDTCPLAMESKSVGRCIDERRRAVYWEPADDWFAGFNDSLNFARTLTSFGNATAWT